MNNAETKAQTEVVEIIGEMGVKTNGSWQPIEGETVRDLEDQILRTRTESRIQEGEWKTIKTEAISVLSKCVPPTAPPRQETGLVVGYVQSGKTLSFTAVAALARDNGYQMVIVIAGTSVNLRDQSTQRLEKDLDLRTLLDRKWMHFTSDEFNEEDHVKIGNALASWQDSRTSQWNRKTVLITAMKQHRHLDKLAHVLSKLNSRLDLSEVPTLVIDDEADQASLNTKVRRGETSTTYQRILSLREYLPHHTFLQYTATPQALLLINLIDVLSPKFAEVLTPGSKYTGGKEFFQDAPNQIRTIPDNEIPTRNDPLDAPPESLLEAMRIFFLGVAAGIILDNGTGCRSMMVHPSHKTIGHEHYHKWIKRVIRNWEKILEQKEGYEKDYQDLLEQFKDSYSSLQSSVVKLPSFEVLSAQLLPAILDVQPHEVNSVRGKTPSIPWHHGYAHILVGGQAMDRGFTVEGLTVTYMPRGRGLGNADTIQQRARFFGYKEDVFGYCRVFLEDDVRDAYKHYVTHEQHVRKCLIEHGRTGKPLNEWKRAFFLDSKLKPTRQNVLDIEYTRVKSRSQWYEPKAPHDSIEAINTNNAIVEKFCKKLSFRDDKGHPKRTIPQIHHEAPNVPLKDAYEELLVPFQFTRSIDSQKFTGVFLLIDAYLESYPDASCTIFRMSRGSLRDRSLDDKNDEIPLLFQGRNPDSGPVIYPGDKSKKAPKHVTVQIHNLRVTRKNGDIFENVPALAIWLPKDISPDWLVQNQGGI